MLPFIVVKEEANPPKSIFDHVVEEAEEAIRV